MTGRTHRPVYRWPHNVNPACSPLFRCGECRKDALATAALQKWADGRFGRAAKLRHDSWSRQEIALVKRLAGAARPGEIVAALLAECGTKRTLAGLHSAVYKRGIRLARQGYSTQELRGVFGVSDDLIRTWIEKGLLQSSRWGLRSQSIRSARVISQQAVEQFIRQSPWIYDFDLMDRNHPLYLVARAANRGERWLGAKELGLQLGLSAQYTADLGYRGVLRCEHRGKLVMFRQSDVREFREILEARRQAHLARLRIGRPPRAVAGAAA